MDFRPRAPNSLSTPVEEEAASEEFSGGAICEWASAPPRIALVAKSWGVSARQLAGGNLPLTGTLTTVQKVYFWYIVGAYRVSQNPIYQR
jgi:hypothetical protein